jgi:hypothetical protein
MSTYDSYKALGDLHNLSVSEWKEAFAQLEQTLADLEAKLAKCQEALRFVMAIGTETNLGIIAARMDQAAELAKVALSPAPPAKDGGPA